MTIQEGLAKNSAGLIALVGRLRAELKTNRRAALGLLAIGCLAAGYGFLGLGDAIDNLRGSYVEATYRLERQVAAGREREWPARAAASAEARRSLEARLWKGQSNGMARADLQDWVTTNAREAGLERVQVKIELAKLKGLPANLREVTATITALDTEASLIAFLDRIKRETRLLVIDHLSVRTQPIPSLEMKLVAYTVVNADAPPLK
jgi:hypothetical protein